MMNAAAAELVSIDPEAYLLELFSESTGSSSIRRRPLVVGFELQKAPRVQKVLAAIPRLVKIDNQGSE